MDKQAEEELSAVRDFLAGRSNEVSPPETADTATRQLVAEELLATMTGADPEETWPQTEGVPSEDAEAPASQDPEGLAVDQLEVPGRETRLEREQQSKRVNHEEQERARKLFMDHGYFDEAVQDLRGAISPQQRAAAARALGVVGSKRGTPHLIAAMFDDDPEVRNTAEQSLGQMSGPSVPGESQNALVDSAESAAVEASDFPAHSATNETSAQDPIVEGAAGPDEHAVVTEESTLHTDSAQEVINSESSLAAAAGYAFDATVQQPTREVGEGSLQTKAEVGHETTTGPAPAHHESINDREALQDPEKLLLEEQSLRKTLKQLDRQLLDVAAVRTQFEKEAVLSIERETKLRFEAAIRRREDEELRQRADEEAERRRSQELEVLSAEHVARAQAEAEAQRIAEDEARMRLEASNLRRVAEERVWQRIGIETARREAAEAARRAEAKNSRDEAGKRHNAELIRLRNEEESLRSATEEAARRRAEIENAQKDAKAEIERLTQERVQLATAEAYRHAEATRLRQEAKTRHEAEVRRLSSEEEALRAEAEKLAQRRAEVGAAQRAADAEIERLARERSHLAAAEAARRAEAERISEAEERNRADHEQLRLELEGLRLVTEEVSTRRAEVEAARMKADEEAERLLEAHARIRADEQASARAEAERKQLEFELHERVKTQQRLLEETRQRAQQEQQRLEDETRQYSEREEQRRTELQLLRTNVEETARRRVEEEKQIRSQVDSLRIADAEARKRIEEAEGRRRKAEDVYRLVAEKVQRVEAEAHLRAVEEEKMLAKLEGVRRSAAIEAQARAEQEKRIKEEIEVFRKLEMVERPRLEVAALQRDEAQAQYQHHIDRVKAHGETRAKAGERLNVFGAPQETGGLHTPNESEHAIANPQMEGSLAEFELEESAPGATSTIQTYLNSVDPYKRAAAVAELARSNARDAFDLIAKCFDDHSSHVRNAVVRGLLKVDPARTIELFNRVLEEGTEDRRRKIGNAIAASGLAAEAIDKLIGDNREDTYNALSILFVMAKTGEVEPLVAAIRENPNAEISEAALKLLTLSGKSEIASAALKQRASARAGGGAQ